MRKLGKAILAIMSETEMTTEVIKVNKAVNEEVVRLTNMLTLRLQSQHLGYQEKADMRNLIEVKRLY